MDDTAATADAVDPRLVSWTHAMYGLHAISIVIGTLTTASGAGWFLFAWPSLAAIIMNYALRSQVRGTALDAHFRWQLWTFWPALALIVGLAPLVFTFVLIRAVQVIYAAVGIWVAYRIGRGWRALRERRTLPA
jgi:uncharacterized membrane protein